MNIIYVPLEEKLVVPTTEKRRIVSINMLPYQASIKVERENDEEPPQYYSVIWWLR